MSIAAYMAVALHDPDSGYYASRDPLGAAGDFVTAPEISQIFGELIGACVIDFWRRIGRPDPVILAELGPGRGTLMTDLLRASRAVPEFHRVVRLTLVEASAVLRREQRRRLAAFEPDIAPRFADGVDGLPEGPLLLVANEFLDALPIRQLIRSRNGWAERLVALAPGSEPETEQLILVEGPENRALALLIPPGLRDAPPGTVVEICPAAAALAASLGKRLGMPARSGPVRRLRLFSEPPGATWPRCAVTGGVDPRRPRRGGSQRPCRFRGFRRGRGSFGRRVARSGDAAGLPARPRSQARLAALSRRATPAQREALESGLARLIDPGADGQFVQGAGLDLAGTAAAGRVCRHPADDDRATSTPPC